MLKRMKNKTILLLFVLLFSGFLVTQFAYERRIKDFKTNLIEIDSSEITSIWLYPETDNQKEFVLIKAANKWAATQGNVTVEADQKLVEDIVNTLALVYTEEVVSQDSSLIKHFGVGTKKGSRVKIYKNKQLLKDFIIGKKDTPTTTTEPITHLRFTEENEIYLIQKDLNKIFNHSFDAFRNQKIVQLDPKKINKISLFNQDSSSLIYEKKDSLWTTPNYSIPPIHIDAYLRKIQNLETLNFVDNFDETAIDSFLFQTLIIEPTNSVEPITIKIFKDSTLSTPFLIHSSSNEDTYFASDSSGVFQQLIINLLMILPTS